MEKQELYIPSEVKTRNEFFNGFGKKELLQSIIGTLVFMLISSVLWLIYKNVSLTVVSLLSGIFGSVMMCVKDHNNLSVVDHVINIIKFNRNQQIYPYRALPEWQNY